MLSAIALSHMGHVGFGFGWPFFFLIPLFWIALIAVIFGIFGRRMRRRAWAGGYGPWGHGFARGASRGAEATLAERFANGDIDEKEYRARLEVLRANDYPTEGK